MTGETFKDSAIPITRKSPPPNSQEDSVCSCCDRPWHGLSINESEYEGLAEEIGEAIEKRIGTNYLDSYTAYGVAHMALEYLNSGTITSEGYVRT
jgi:hypothetical protein